MGVIVDLIEVVRSRIVAQATGGGTLPELENKVFIGPRRIVQKMSDYPRVYIWIAPEGGVDRPYSLTDTFVDEVNIEVNLLANKLADDDNKLYDTSDLSGSIYLFERLLNAIDTGTGLCADLTFEGKANNLRQYSYSVSYDNNIVEFSIIMTAETDKFQSGFR